MITKQALLSVLSRFPGLKVLVIGDMVADEYIFGRPSRISREAPILILEYKDEFTVPGGATNPAVNARALEAEVYLAGVIGQDLPGKRLRRKLESLGLHLEALISEADRPTSTKLRIIAGSTQETHQQIARVDRIDASELETACKARIIAAIEQIVPAVDAVLVSDYENGVINPDLIAACLPLARRHNKVITVDSHGDLFRFKDVTVLTPNQPEAEATLHTTIRTLEDLEAAGRQLLAGTGAQGVLITRGSEGMSLFERNQPAIHLPVSNYTEVRDVTGAGDTVAATFTLALAAGARMMEAAHLANIAAGLVVRRIGCATTTIEELRESIQRLLPSSDSRD